MSLKSVHRSKDVISAIEKENEEKDFTYSA